MKAVLHIYELIRALITGKLRYDNGDEFHISRQTAWSIYGPHPFLWKPVRYARNKLGKKEACGCEWAFVQNHRVVFCSDHFLEDLNDRV